jgi:hypothetical protein
MGGVDEGGVEAKLGLDPMAFDVYDNFFTTYKF